jgi:hypothetical protein
VSERRLTVPAEAHEAFCRAAPAVALLLAILSWPLLPVLGWWQRARAPVGRFVERSA